MPQITVDLVSTKTTPGSSLVVYFYAILATLTNSDGSQFVNMGGGESTYSWFQNGHLVQSGPSAILNVIFASDDPNGPSLLDVNVAVDNSCGTSSSGGGLNRPATITNNLADTMENSSTNSNQTYTISPNPANDIVNISVSGAVPIVTQISNSEVLFSTKKVEGFDAVTIYDTRGSIVKQEVFNQVPQATIDISNLSSGVYIVEILNKGSKQQQKLVIQK
ncbi:MAG TPA: T9SS type A sorting domain-containing protein [Ferruginibacter sp.]|nr:T9SS type A sorting domain-containing protein [Ferruginibacter sp.]